MAQPGERSLLCQCPPTPTLPKTQRLAQACDRWQGPLGRMCPAPCSWAHSCLIQTLPVGQLPLEVSPRAVAPRAQSSVFPFRCAFPLLLGLHLEERTLLGSDWQPVPDLELHITAGMWTELIPKWVSQGREQGTGNGFSWIPASGRAWRLPELLSNSCAWDGKAISSLLFPFQE